MTLLPHLDRFYLKLEALRSFETSVTVCLAARCHVPEDLNLMVSSAAYLLHSSSFLKSENLHVGNHDGHLARCHRDVREDSTLR